MSSQKYHILVVDDDDVDREFVQRMLIQSGLKFSLNTATCYNDGLEHIISNKYDCIILDYQLGSHTGLELLHAMKKTMDPIPFPIIVLTDQKNDKLAAELIKSGAKDYLSKANLFPSELARSIETVATQFQLDKVLEKQHKLLKQRTDDLQLKNSEIQSFYHILSHELKTPLMVIREFSSIIHDEIAGPLNTIQREYLDIVMGCCDQMKYMIDDMLDVSRLDTGKFTLIRKSENIEEVVAHAVNLVKPIASGKSITLTRLFDSNLSFEIQIDRKRILQVLMNLLNNAIKHTPLNGIVTIEISQDHVSPYHYSISVSDTGQGIEAQHLSHIFDKFYQVDASNEHSSANVGLGLYLCREIIKLHGGEISVSSEIGKGSKFGFTLPHVNTNLTT